MEHVGSPVSLVYAEAQGGSDSNVSAPNTARRCLAEESSMSKRVVNTDRMTGFPWRPSKEAAGENQVVRVANVPGWV